MDCKIIPGTKYDVGKPEEVASSEKGKIQVCIIVHYKADAECKDDSGTQTVIKVDGTDKFCIASEIKDFKKLSSGKRQ